MPTGPHHHIHFLLFINCCVEIPFHAIKFFFVCRENCALNRYHLMLCRSCHAWRIQRFFEVTELGKHICEENRVYANARCAWNSWHRRLWQRRKYWCWVVTFRRMSSLKFTSLFQYQVTISFIGVSVKSDRPCGPQVVHRSPNLDFLRIISTSATWLGREWGVGSWFFAFKKIRNL